MSPTIRPYKIIDEEYVEQSSYTLDLDLPTSGILSSLMLRVKAKPATTGVCAGPWIKYLVSSVSVNQAGQAFLNAAPPAAFQADYYYKTGKMPTRGHVVADPDGAIVLEDVPINFGNFPNDLDHTIDLSKLNDPKLSVTYNLATTGPNGETIWDTDFYPRFTVVAHLIQGAGIPASKGYHSLRQIESYTPVNSQEKKIELKGTRPIKRIYIALDKTAPIYGWIHSLDQIKLWGDNEAWTPFIAKCDDWYELIKDIFGLCNVKTQVYYVKGGVDMDSCVDKRVHLDAHCLGPGTLFRARGGSGRVVRLYEILISDGTSPATVYRSSYDFTGYTPWTTGIIDMEKMLGMEYLDPTDRSPIYLELDHVSNAAAIGGPVKIYIEDLVPPL